MNKNDYFKHVLSLFVIPCIFHNFWWPGKNFIVYFDRRYTPFLRDHVLVFHGAIKYPFVCTYCKYDIPGMYIGARLSIIEISPTVKRRFYRSMFFYIKTGDFRKNYGNIMTAVILVPCCAKSSAVKLGIYIYIYTMKRSLSSTRTDLKLVFWIWRNHKEYTIYFFFHLLITVLLTSTTYTPYDIAYHDKTKIPGNCFPSNIYNVTA